MMPFGMLSALEEYQRRQDQAGEEHPGVLSITKDLCVW